MRALTAGVLTIAAALHAAPARAQARDQPTWAPPSAPSASAAARAAPFGPAAAPRDTRDDEALDPLLPTAIAETGVGALIGVAGVVMIASAHAPGPERCGDVAGCIDGIVEPGADLDGRYVLGGGLGLAAAGGLTWAIVATSPLDPGERYDSPGGAIAGSILVGAGAFGVGSIIGGSTSASHETGYNVLIGLAAVPALAVGIPLLATSVDAESPERTAREKADEVAIDQGAPTRAASPGMLAAGVTCTALGGIGALAGTGMIGANDGDIGLVLGGLVATGSAVLLLGIGIPLTVVGGRPVRDQASPPVVRVGLGSIDVSGQF